jgi:hypothetical protein
MEALLRWNPTVPDDDASKEAIRRHMQKIAGMFAQGDFSFPCSSTTQVPPGVEAMKHLKDQITYTAEKAVKGAQGADRH